MSKQSVRKILTEFISQCKEKHGDTYDYSESIYLGSYKKIAIKCRTHGEFWIWPNDHRHGIGCARCSGCKVDPIEFIEQMKIKHPKFDFSKFEYKGAKVLSTVICPIHGEFLKHPNDLKNIETNHGCGKCSIDTQLKVKIEKGIIRDPKNISEYENYRRKVWNISNQQYRAHKDKINPLNIPRSLTHHLDHKYSIQQGWRNKIPAEIIGGWKNLRIIDGKKNRQKGNKCEITLDLIHTPLVQSDYQ
jgi:hypothetical protein